MYLPVSTASFLTNSKTEDLFAYIYIHELAYG